MSVGLHPWFLPLDPDALDVALASFSPLLDDPAVVALGETGLDRGRRAAPWDLQVRSFDHQVALALRRRLPLVIHCVRAHGGCLERLPLGAFGIVHDFTGGPELVGRWVARGFCLSLSPRSRGRPDLLRMIPPSHLLLESDDAGSDAFLALFEDVVRHSGRAAADVAAGCAENAERIFGRWG